MCSPRTFDDTAICRSSLEAGDSVKYLPFRVMLETRVSASKTSDRFTIGGVLQQLWHNFRYSMPVLRDSSSEELPNDVGIQL